MSNLFITLVPKRRKELDAEFWNDPDLPEGLTESEAEEIRQRALVLLGGIFAEQGDGARYERLTVIGIYRSFEHWFLLVGWKHIFNEWDVKGVAEDAFGVLKITGAKKQEIDTLFKAAFKRRRWEKACLQAISETGLPNPNTVRGRAAILKAAGLDAATIKRQQEEAVAKARRRLVENLSLWLIEHPRPPKV
ncbi:TPA: hypothetical protein DEA21_03020 [Candidatus Uhrbacteria bacterium]|nr:hypothetical protein [Candidatus Uhrbacteria bacterium]HCU32106.1 hypothetical protein [Candidatus Uhrbacteria bacterium]